MDVQGRIAPLDVNKALRDRLGRNRTAATSIRQAAELEMAVNELQDLARSRFADPPGGPFC